MRNRRDSRPILTMHIGVFKSLLPSTIRQPAHYKGAALPIELRRQKLSIVLLVPYNRQNDTLIVSYSEDFRRTTNFLEPVTIDSSTWTTAKPSSCSWQKAGVYICASSAIYISVLAYI